RAPATLAGARNHTTSPRGGHQMGHQHDLHRDQDATTTALGQRRGTRTLPALTALAAAVLLGVGGYLGLGPAPDTGATEPAPAATHSTTPSPTRSDDHSPDAPTTAPSSSPKPSPERSATTPSPVPPTSSPAPGRAQPAASAPVHLTVPAAGIDQPILPLAPSTAELANQSIVPPMTMDAYWLATYGTPGAGSTNTTYITGHSWEGADAPFDRLSTHLNPGDTITLSTQTGAIDYTVDTVTTHDKNTLKNSDIWRITPQRLVIISCYTNDPWGKNVVITASPTP
ncbi:class F sortase, partial [Kocuria turfanensis]|uniref:class F sortase n=2 Tax=Kocuria turfanensis TaxID=388357 RepID=UPI0021C1882B